MLKKKIWANFQRIIELFTKKIVTKLSKIWVWDPGSEIRYPGSGKNLFRIRDPGSRGQKGTGFRIPGSGSATLVVMQLMITAQSVYTAIVRLAAEVTFSLKLYIISNGYRRTTHLTHFVYHWTIFVIKHNGLKNY
jgi:hypothetical protein